MPDLSRSRPLPTASLSFWLLCGFLVVLCITGGASRADALTQPLTRFVAWLLLVVFALLGPRLEWRRLGTVGVLLGAAVVLTAIQLVPLPPAVWTGLPGRALIEGVATVTGQPQPWRPISISPSATRNALASLVVPVTVLVLAANLTREQHWRVLALIFALIVSASVLGLLQFSGARIDNPLINDVAGVVSANFANRNHFALFLAIGCVLAPAWAFHGEELGAWKKLTALALLPFFVLMLLATGSRAGLILGVVGTGAGILMVRRSVGRDLRRLPRNASLAAVAALAALLASTVWLSITLDRAVAIDRAFDLAADEGSRGRALPYVIEAVKRYFPVGSGFGAFDPVYRISEPDSLLSPQYFNHAHNDWIEVVMDGGLASTALLIAGLAWWVMQTRRAWWETRERGMLPKAGSTIILLIMLASVFDYPARTPLIMGVLMMAAIWLAHPSPSANDKGDPL